MDRIDANNLTVGMYAIRALEQVGPPAKRVLPSFRRARNSPYEFPRCCARRLTRNLGN